MIFSKKWLLQVFFIALFNIIPQSLFAGLDSSLSAQPVSLFESLYAVWFKPDCTMPSLDDLNIVSLLPIECCSDDYVVSEAQDGKDRVINLLKKKDGIITIKGKLYKIYNKIPKKIRKYEEPINLYLGGFSNSNHPHAFSVYKAIKEGTMQGPCIVFECAPDAHRRTFNFCQEQDLECVDLVYNDLLEKHNDAQIILRGGCKGASVYLRFLAEKAENGKTLENIKACIANYPPISLKDALKDIRYGGVFSYWFCRFTLPNYNPNSKTILDATAFPTDIPVLLTCLPRGFDRITDLEDMERINEHLKSLRATIDLFVSEGYAKDDNGKQVKLGHGQLGRAKDYQKVVISFLKNQQLLT